MHDNEDSRNAFAIPDLWERSTFADLEEPVDGQYEGLWFTASKHSRNSLDSVGKGLVGFPVPLANTKPGDCFSATFLLTSIKDLDLHLPDLSSFQYGPLKDLENLEPSLASSIGGSICSLPFRKQEEEDVWSAAEILDPTPTPAELKSWERFLGKAKKEPRTAYISDGGPSVFDALIAQSTRSHPGLPGASIGHVLQCGPVVTSLLQLGLGRESLLYYWVEQEGSFRPRVGDGRMSGYSSEAFNDLAADFISYGNQARKLHSFVNESYLVGKPFASLIAVAEGFSKVLATLEAQLCSSVKTVSSLLQLQFLFHRPGHILSCLSKTAARLSTAKSDEEILSKLYGFVEELEHSTTWLRPLAFQILAHASRPWLESVGVWIGLQMKLGTESQDSPPTFVISEEGLPNDEVDEESQEANTMSSQMPSFITNEDAQSIIESGTGLRLLHIHKPEHPLGKPEALSPLGPPELAWQFSWQDVQRIQARAKNYESSLLKAIKEFDMSESRGQGTSIESDHFQQNTLGLFEVPTKMIQKDFGLLTEDLEKPLPELNVIEDVLSKTVVHCIKLCNEDMEEEAALFAPPLSLVPLLSFSPAISTQTRLINKACLRLLFKEHSLRSHLSLQYRYHFLGDGIFASRLSHALFDPELQTAERRKGHSRSGVSGFSGLQLGSRDNWPPASSELRLALMGILSESYYQNRQDEGSSSRLAELPGGLSFAIRGMPDDELQRCLDPDSIEALDFLRLQYKSPPPLDVVITASSLAKYDTIFKFLLRATRMTFVVNQLFHDRIKRSCRSHKTVAQRFTMEARHFISATCSYFFDGVVANWVIFEGKLAKIEEHLDDQSSGDAEGIHLLQSYHEKVLDRIMFALILRKRQEQVMKLLEEIFSSILRFSSIVRRSPTGETESREKETKIQEIYDRFRKKVRVFTTVCRGLSERMGQGGTKRHELDDGLFIKRDADEDGGNTMAQLLLKLEMSGYYSKPIH